MNVRTMAPVAALVAMLSLLAFPGVAVAQDDTYPPDDPGGSVTGVDPEVEEDIIDAINQGGTLGSIQVPTETTAQVTIPASVADIVTGIVVSNGETVFSGPVPEVGSVTFATDGCSTTVTVTYTFANGAVRVDTFNIDGVGACASAGGTAGTENLAFTGSEVSTPLAAGALLIGAGGLMFLAANKKRRQTV